MARDERFVSQSFEASVPADGNWHVLVERLAGLNGFEIAATASGAKGEGSYGMLHAIALSAHGGAAHAGIRTTESWYASEAHGMDLRWAGTTYTYSLQIRTRSSFGEDARIRARLTWLFRE